MQQYCLVPFVLYEMTVQRQGVGGDGEDGGVTVAFVDFIVENIPFEETRNYVDRVESAKKTYIELYGSDA